MGWAGGALLLRHGGGGGGGHRQTIGVAGEVGVAGQTGVTQGGHGVGHDLGGARHQDVVAVLLLSQLLITNVSY